MKRLVPMLVFLFFAWGVQASGGNVHYETSGTSDFSVTFKSMAQGFAVLASSNPVTIIAYASTTAVDTMYVEAGNSMFFYCPANHIHIDRTLATAVTINPTFNNTIIPSLGISTVKLQTAIDSIATAVYAPTPVTVSDPILLWDVTRFTQTGGTTSVTQKIRTLPVIGENVDGAKGLMLIADWDFFKGTTTGSFSIQTVYSTVAGDTFASNQIDSTAGSASRNFWRIDSLVTPIKQGTGYESFVVRLPNNAALFQGYLHITVDVPGGCDLRGFRIAVIKEY
jgi:hypothetical protein